MKFILARAGLALTKFGIWILELAPYSMLDEKDKAQLAELWESHDKFESIIEGEK